MRQKRRGLRPAILAEVARWYNSTGRLDGAVAVARRIEDAAARASLLTSLAVAAAGFEEWGSGNPPSRRRCKLCAGVAAFNGARPGAERDRLELYEIRCKTRLRSHADGS